MTQPAKPPIPPKPPINDDLEAYIDGRLEGERVAEIEALLAADSKMAEMVQAMRFQNDGLRCLGQEILNEPIPDRLRSIVEDRKTEEAATGRKRILLPAAPRRLAIFLVMIAASLAGG